MATKDSGKVLVDTSAWIDYFGKKEPAYSNVSALMSVNRVCCIGLIMAELMQGAKSAKEMNVIRDFTQVFDFLPGTVELWLQAGELSYSLRQSGKPAGLADCYIASVATWYQVALFTFDRGFEDIRDFCKLDLHLA